ncbi:putative bifunctional diguanylate cyclase/phosphodiesterase [Oricola thermophila]|uniref:EAL domain-containing protein n=1 Tax=Oricola thermophila TaxID=2742145 RepID=A0A6N1VFK4_9HYPH|nr:EAL domain-containing protein [Oricola thermophila]QKV19716.1 EAL domain-containing protein [Oricola thermophila]
MKLEEQLELSAFQSAILEAVATGSDFTAVSDRICRGAEMLAQGTYCTIVSVDEAGLLHPVSAPSLPDSYSQALEGLPIGPDTGSCGTAAYLGEPVHTEDIATDPKWADYRGLALPLGLRACWSTPIKSRDGRPVATFAFYFREKRSSTEMERELVARCAHLCTIAYEHTEMTARNHFLAYRDQLTGLGNRRSFEAAFNAPALFHDSFGLLMLDIDNLKIVNDSLGHEAGDQLISAVARRLKKMFGPDHAFRLGGDEFAIIRHGCGDHETLEETARALLDLVMAPIVQKGATINPSVTLGGVINGADGSSPEQLRQNADLTLYHAKETRRGGYMRFDPGHKTSIVRRIDQSRQLAEALNEDRVLAHFQPVVSLETGRITGVEALARIRQPDGRIAEAGEFLMAFADPRNAARLTDRMIDLTTRDFRGWLDEGLPIEHMALNLTTADFRATDLDVRLGDAFGKAGIPLKHLHLEVTETVMMENRLVRQMSDLRERGVRLALDDFGTGFASLTHLLSFPVDIIKIDKTFVTRLLSDRPSAAIVQALIDIARKIGIDIVAEGVEETEQAERLATLGCHYAQGYLFSRPADAATIARLLRSTLPTGRIDPPEETGLEDKRA